MFHPAAVFEEGDIVRRRLDAQHEMELVVHLHLGFAEAVLDAGALDAGLETRADFLASCGVIFLPRKLATRSAFTDSIACRESCS
jgi:hypothetical protein